MTGFSNGRTTLVPGQLSPRLFRCFPGAPTPWPPLRVPTPGALGALWSHVLPPSLAGGPGWAWCWELGSWARQPPRSPKCTAGMASSCNTCFSHLLPSSPCCVSCCCRRAAAARCPNHCRTLTACAAPRSSGAAHAKTSCPCCQPPSLGQEHSWSRRGDQAVETLPSTSAGGRVLGGWWGAHLFPGALAPLQVGKIKVCVELGFLSGSSLLASTLG